MGGDIVNYHCQILESATDCYLPSSLRERRGPSGFVVFKEEVTLTHIDKYGSTIATTGLNDIISTSSRDDFYVELYDQNKSDMLVSYRGNMQVIPKALFHF